MSWVQIIVYFIIYSIIIGVYSIIIGISVYSIMKYMNKRRNKGVK